MAARSALPFFVLVLYVCWAPCSSITRSPVFATNAIKLSTDEALDHGLSSSARFRGKRDDNPFLPSYQIRPLGDAQGAGENHSAISPLWVKGNVLLVLTQDDEKTRSSHLYRYTKDLFGSYYSSNISHLIGSAWSAVKSMKLSAADDSVVFIVSKDKRSLFVSKDASLSWERHALPSSSFELDYDLLFSPMRASDMVLYDNRYSEIYFSKNYGKLWTKLQSGVVQMDWDADDTAKTLHYTFYTKTDSSNSAYSHTFHRVDAKFTKIEKTDENVYRMVVDGRFVFTSKQNVSDVKNQTRRLYSSSDHGKTFRQAHMPAVGPAQAYVLLTTHQAGAFIQHKTSGTNSGTLYVSDSGATYFSVSLENHFYNTDRYYHDVYEVKSVRGVYITSVLVEGKLQSRITFDNGGVWDSLTLRPKSWKPSSCKDQCQLNLHLQSSVIGHGKKEVLMQGPVSHATAPGLIVATGMFQSISSATWDSIDVTVTSSATYLVVSNDGGETWFVPNDLDQMPGYYLFGIFDYGNAIVVIESQQRSPNMWFSNDRGNSFQLKQVTSQPFFVRGFLPVPEAGDLIAAVFGQENTTSPKWEVMFLNLKPYLHRPCDKTDYTSWTPKGNCILGQNITYTIAKPKSRCYNPASFDYSSHKATNCTCSYKVDFECVYGYERASNLSCVQIANLSSSLLKSNLCPPGQDTYNKSLHGYRRVPGDMCSGGDEGLLKTVNKTCKDHEEEAGYGYLGAHWINGTNVGVAIASVLSVLVIMLLIALAILIIYWYKKRSRSNEPVGYTRLPVSELESDRQKEGEEEEKGATDLDEEMLNPVV